MTSKSLTCAVVSAFFALLSVVNAQVSLQKIPLEKQVLNSNLVVEGKVVSKASFWDAAHKMIYTAHTVEVYKVFKGKSLETIEILTLGGFVGLDGITASHALQLDAGSIGVFMLNDAHATLSSNHKSKWPLYRAYSGIQGFYSYDMASDEVANVFSKQNGIQTVFYKTLCGITQKQYQEKKTLTSLEALRKRSGKNVAGVPSNIAFSPTTISAGTKSILTITGNGFGTNRGSVAFRNADSGGFNFVDALDSQILSWSDTQIRVEVPADAGTGDIVVRDAARVGRRSSGILTIIFSEINVVTENNGAFQVQHYNDNDLGGYTWDLEQRFFNDADHPGARLAFENAINTWRCETDINWEVSNTPSSDTTSEESDHIVAFDGGTIEQLPSGTLGITFSGYTGRECSNGIFWAVVSLDIVFDREANWHFGDDDIQIGQFDFESVALHELGHAHQLGHVIDQGNLMHFATLSQSVNRNMDDNSIVGANGVQLRSTNNRICDPNLPLMTNYVGSCSLGVVDDDDAILETGSVIVFPNPAKEELFIKNQSSQELNAISIFDLRGRRVFHKAIETSFETQTISIRDVSRGLYIIVVSVGDDRVSSKLVLD